MKRVITITTNYYSFSFSSAGELQWHKFPEKLRGTGYFDDPSKNVPFTWTVYKVYSRDEPEATWRELFLPGTFLELDKLIITLPKEILTKTNIRLFKKAIDKMVASYYG